MLEGASGSHRISAGSTVSNLALAGSAHREQWVNNSGASTQPTCLLIPRVDPNSGFKNIPAVLGPMARTVEDIEIACRVVFGRSANYSSAPVPYREVELGQKLKFGFYFNDGMARTTPACCRAVSETVEALRKHGHECVEFELPFRALPTCPSCVLDDSLCATAEKASEVFIALSSASGNKDFLKNKGPDPTVKSGILALFGLC